MFLHRYNIFERNPSFLAINFVPMVFIRRERIRQSVILTIYFKAKDLELQTRFNPRTHIGCDGWVTSVCSTSPCFNPRTHRVRLCKANNWVGKIKFQSTHPYRVRPAFPNLTITYDKFQSTHPYRVRCPPTKFCSSFREFQSTHPLGCDSLWGGYKASQAAFQSTHPQGATLGRQCIWNRRVCVSIHAPIRVRLV